MMFYSIDLFTKSKRGLHGGFTLVEALVIIFILGIVTALAIPTLQSGLAESKLAGASGEITVALEYAQLVAMTSGSQTRVTIDAANDTILVERFTISGDITGGAAEIAENDIESGAFATVAHPASRGKDYNIIFADEDRFDGVDIASATFGGGQTVTFDAMGVPSNGGTVTLSFGSNQVILTVDALSGKVTSSS
ncbi:MAG: prepilin-type N-terminal cleavage/methylation domain-containing protein [Desulfobacterales bacterium]|uniref:Type II secretion system protein H n=1 Tax=Candidatus Desulfatibia vada TaxID=2841696 RepID=A0A8J6P0W8_9BACT|nr:prepilin-type N-terminal cleavage/methylation domain-containing protein [Candidatus Desulfatibia vada]